MSTCLFFGIMIALLAGLKEYDMPEQKTIEKAKEDAREGKAPSTQAGEFVREEMHRIREGRHGAANAKQAIAIGLSEARRSGVKLPSRGKKKTSSAKKRRRPSIESRTKRSRASLKALKKKPRAAASHRALSRHAKASAKKRGPAARKAAAKKAARTKAKSASRRNGHKSAQTRRRQAA